MATAATLNLVRTGPREAPPVVLLHSAGLDLTYWDPQIAALRECHDVVAVDLPGHGRSPARAADITIDTVTHAVAVAVAALATGPVNLVGLSVGGLVAQAVALDHPQLVSSVTLIDTAARFGPAAQTAMRARAETTRNEGMGAILDGLFAHWFEPETRRARPDLIDRATKTLLQQDPHVHAGLWEMISSFDVLDRLREVLVPALVLVGEHDSSSPVSSSEELAANLPRAVMHVVSNAAHLSPIERPHAVTRQLAAFLESLPANRGSA